MQTVASMAERLDMSAEEAVEKLRFMLFDVEGVDASITDEQCDILIDVDEDPSIAEEIRAKKLKEQEAIQKRNERLRKAAEKKRAEAAKKKAEKTKEEAEEKPAPKKRAKAKTPETETTPTETLTGHPLAEILPPEEPDEETTAKKKKKEKPKAESPAIIIGSAIEHDTGKVEVVRADGTHLAAPEVELVETIEEITPPEDEDTEVTGLLAEAERREEEEERRKVKAPARALPKPDPAVVAKVKEKAALERAKRVQAQRTTGGTGKTARKRQKRLEKLRAEETMRRDAAAAIREYQAGGLLGGGPRKRKRKRPQDLGGTEPVEVIEKLPLIEVQEGMTVEELANLMEVPVSDLILGLMDLDVLATKNQTLSMDLIKQLASEQGFEVESAIPEEDKVLAEEPDDPADLRPRAPVITVMGHVDHGKTSFLDVVREANVAEGEAGGITQHIAAYDVPIGNGRIVFLDTPGHEAFTHMRARGAQITDIVVLVVAADDGVMPQTIEAIDHAKAAEVPIVVAINKCDKPEAQPDRIRQELTRYGLIDEQWGGKTIMRNISAKMRQGVSELLELLVLEAEMLELKANPNKRARGTIIESEISRGQGPVAWVLVQNGTLRIGDVFLAGNTFGRVRAMINSRGETVEAAGPSTPVVVTGFSEPPDAGDAFIVLDDERVARSIATQRSEHERRKQGQKIHRITLEDFHKTLIAGQKNELNVVIKADVQGSVDVLESSFAKLGNDEVSVNIVHAGVGGINESDILLASASGAVIIGFHVTANPRVAKLAEQEGVDIRPYRIIYEAIEDVRKALEGMLKPETKEVIVGHAEIRQVFRSSALGAIAGCYVTDGIIERGSKARLIRDDVVIYDGALASLRREKDDVREAQSGFECGIKLERYEDIKEGDIIETYRLESVAKTLN